MLPGQLRHVIVDIVACAARLELRKKFIELLVGLFTPQLNHHILRVQLVRLGQHVNLRSDASPLVI